MSKHAIATKIRTRKLSREVFVNEDGAIDLASIMVGIIVIGLIGGVIAATVFAIIPWAQDNAAKQQLDSIATAQDAFLGLTSDAEKPQYGSVDFLANPDSEASPLHGKDVDSLLDIEKMAASGQAEIYAYSDDKGNPQYQAAVLSPSGNVWMISSTNRKPTLIGTSSNPYNPVKGPVNNGTKVGSLDKPLTWEINPADDRTGQLAGFPTQAEIDALKAADRSSTAWSINMSVSDLTEADVQTLPDMSNIQLTGVQGGGTTGLAWVDGMNRITITTPTGDVYTQVGASSGFQTGDGPFTFSDAVVVNFDSNMKIKSIEMNYVGFRAKDPSTFTYSQTKAMLKNSTVEVNTSAGEKYTFKLS